MIDVIMKQLRNQQMSVSRLLTLIQRTIKYHFISVVWPRLSRPGLMREPSLQFKGLARRSNDDIREDRGQPWD